MTYQQSSLVDEYIAGFSEETQRRLRVLRKAIQATLPKTVEDMSYGMPTYRPLPGKRGIVHFAGHANHIGIYAIFDPHDNPLLHQKMQPYRSGRGTLQFRSDQPFPTKDIREFLVYHASQFPESIFTK